MAWRYLEAMPCMLQDESQVRLGRASMQKSWFLTCRPDI